MAVKLTEKYLAPFVSPKELEGIAPMVAQHDKEEVVRIKAAAQRIQKDSKALVVIGIGGSYLGARSAIELMKGTFYNSLRKAAPRSSSPAAISPALI